MNVIDLEILIPASPEFIWRFMGDLSAIPQWHDDVISISFLSTQREGRGTRWRHQTVKGSDIVIEVSAWYDTLGYEYRVVDGKTYSENQGRLRLQEVSDGTLVRWTFQYELGGMLGGLRNSMRIKRSTKNQIQNSLGNLHQLIARESGGISTHEAKASMQDAPDVHERSHYQPRHPSAFQEDVDVLPPSDDDTRLSEYHPLAEFFEIERERAEPEPDSDTKPNPVVLGGADELFAADEPEAELDDTRPMEIETLLAESEAPAPQPPPLDEAPPLEEAPPRDERPALDALEPVGPAPRPKPVAHDGDASSMSVFEIFGLQKPSEARAQAQSARDFAGREPLEDRRRGNLAPPADAALVNEAEDEPRPPLESSPSEEAFAVAPIAGWRRSARRRKTALRSHA